MKRLLTLGTPSRFNVGSISRSSSSSPPARAMRIRLLLRFMAPPRPGPSFVARLYLCWKIVSVVMLSTMPSTSFMKVIGASGMK